MTRPASIPPAVELRLRRCAKPHARAVRRLWRCGITWAELAAICDVPRSTVSSWAHARAVPPVHVRPALYVCALVSPADWQTPEQRRAVRAALRRAGAWLQQKAQRRRSRGGRRTS